MVKSGWEIAVQTAQFIILKTHVGMKGYYPLIPYFLGGTLEVEWYRVVPGTTIFLPPKISEGHIES